MAYPSAVRQQAITRILASRTPIAQVARDIGSSPNTIRGWLNQHRQQNGLPSEQPASAVFVPVKVIDNSPPHSVEVVLANGVTLRLTETSPQYIAELLHAIAPC